MSHKENSHVPLKTVIVLLKTLGSILYILTGDTMSTLYYPVISC
jgi:hypothetical protein